MMRSRTMSGRAVVPEYLKEASEPLTNAPLAVEVFASELAANRCRSSCLARVTGPKKDA